jgi:hypothetical protein
MKKYFAFAAVAGMVAIASCGDAGEAAQKLLDSMRQDSAMHAENDKRMEDSMKAADSVKAANEAAMMKHIADSTAAADSAAKNGKKK